MDIDPNQLSQGNSFQPDWRSALVAAALSGLGGAISRNSNLAISSPMAGAVLGGLAGIGKAGEYQYQQYQDAENRRRQMLQMALEQERNNMARERMNWEQNTEFPARMNQYQAERQAKEAQSIQQTKQKLISQQVKALQESLNVPTGDIGTYRTRVQNAQAAIAKILNQQAPLDPEEFNAAMGVITDTTNPQQPAPVKMPEQAKRWDYIGDQIRANSLEH